MRFDVSQSDITSHQETAYNVQGIIQGQMDTPLNALGRKQALLTGKALAQTPLNAIYSSPLQRTMDVSKPVSAEVDGALRLTLSGSLPFPAFAACLSPHS